MSTTTNSQYKPIIQQNTSEVSLLNPHNHQIQHSYQQSYGAKAYNSPKAHPISLFSLAGLKSIFFQRTVTLIPQRKNYGSVPSSDNDDVESQSSEATEVGDDAFEKKIGWKIDARVISDATVCWNHLIKGTVTNFKKKIGLSDGLTVPFALTAGLSALGNTRVVIYGGFAELIAGAISMGLGGYLGAKSEL